MLKVKLVFFATHCIYYRPCLVRNSVVHSPCIFCNQGPNPRYRNVSACSSCSFWMSMRHAMPSLAIAFVLSTLIVGCIYGWLGQGDPPAPVVLPTRWPTDWCHQRSEGSWLFALQFESPCRISRTNYRTNTETHTNGPNYTVSAQKKGNAGKRRPLTSLKGNSSLRLGDMKGRMLNAAKSVVVHWITSFRENREFHLM